MVGQTQDMPPEPRTPDERADEEVVCELPNDTTAPARGRELVRATFVKWGLDILVDDAELAVSELVTNAVKHGLPPVILTLCQRAGTVTADVSDTRPATASLEWPSPSKGHDESGRGRGIIAAVSDRSGTDESDGQGKTSYASWDVDPHTPSGL